MAYEIWHMKYGINAGKNQINTSSVGCGCGSHRNVDSGVEGRGFSRKRLPVAAGRGAWLWRRDRQRTPVQRPDHFALSRELRLRDRGCDWNSDGLVDGAASGGAFGLSADHQLFPQSFAAGVDPV